MRKRVIIFSVIIIILLIIAFVCIFQKEKTDRVFNVYEKLRNSQNFTFSMEEQNSEFKYKVSMVQRGTDVSIDMYVDEEHTTTLILQNEAYYIMHDEEEYYNYGDEEIDSDLVLSGLNNLTKKEYVTGKEKIDGKTYYYEEYENEEMNFIIYVDINETSIIKTRVYFDGDNIAYIKNIVTSEDFNQEELIKVNLTYSIDEKLFEIPEDYAEVQY